MQAKDRIIVALDFDNLADAESLIKQLAGQVGYFKAGLEMLMTDGPQRIIKAVHEAGCKVFIDGKFHDIPNTVGAASRAIVAHGADMFNLHASNGAESIRAAADHKGDALLLAVTVLTSIDDDGAKVIYNASARTKVLQFAQLAQTNGANGIVCSAADLEFLSRDANTKSLLKVTPGVRPDWAAVGDQKRVMTPGQAIKAGADYLVIGRPITRPPAEIGSPAEAVKRIVAELS